jgi:hypothetical protein
MVNKALAFLLLLGVVFPLPAAAEDSIASFRGGIGVIPVSSGVGTLPTAVVVNRNIVRGVQPAGQIWVIADLSADVEDDGDIRVRGKGLILGGGNNIGRATGQSVIATLICETAPSSFTEHSTTAAGVPLEPNGDFRIDDMLSPAPTDCPNPVLLIRSAALPNRAWFAAGILNFGDEDDDDDDDGDED